MQLVRGSLEGTRLTVFNVCVYYGGRKIDVGAGKHYDFTRQGIQTLDNKTHICNSRRMKLYEVYNE